MSQKTLAELSLFLLGVVQQLKKELGSQDQSFSKWSHLSSSLIFPNEEIREKRRVRGKGRLEVQRERKKKTLDSVTKQCFKCKASSLCNAAWGNDPHLQLFAKSLKAEAVPVVCGSLIPAPLHSPECSLVATVGSRAFPVIICFPLLRVCSVGESMTFTAGSRAAGRQVWHQGSSWKLAPWSLSTSFET